MTFLITSHVTGLDFIDENDKKARIQQADEAIRLINLLASDEEKIKSLEAHDELADFIEKQLMGYVDSLEKAGRTDCLLYDLAKKVIESGEGRLRCYIEVVCGLFQAGLGATGNFLCLCLEFLINGDAYNKPEDVRAYYFSPDRTMDEKREAVLEMIRVTQKKLGGLLPRYAPADAILMGDEIQGNSLIYLNFVSANLDEQGFAEPLSFNPNRSQIPPGLSKEEISERRALRKEKNLSFSYGEHMCPGRRIALVILQIVFDEFFARFPNAEVLSFEAHTEIFGKPSEVLGLKLNLHTS
ncbi:MAG: cytochrome P450 [Pseudomonadales bacterium]|nr:cytochrome P450 [Pseudomonadales bacterium]